MSEQRAGVAQKVAEQYWPRDESRMLHGLQEGTSAWNACYDPRNKFAHPRVCAFPSQEGAELSSPRFAPLD